jgi:hypothetical protein
MHNNADTTSTEAVKATAESVNNDANDDNNNKTKTKTKKNKLHAFTNDDQRSVIMAMQVRASFLCWCGGTCARGVNARWSARCAWGA